MKKILTLALLLFLVGCTAQDDIDSEPNMDKDHEQETDIDDDEVETEKDDDDSEMDDDTETDTVTEMVLLTLEELSKYNGIDMEKMYISVDDIIYDVTNEGAWSTGVHNGLKVGMDLTEGFKMSPHSNELLDGLVKVGTLDVVEFDLEQLSMYNGSDMDMMYIAVDGFVYDVTNEAAWSTGVHNGLKVGTDVTDGFMMSPHSDELLDELMIVGRLNVIEYTLGELAMYDGESNSMMYIAVSGIVYDVTNDAAWSSGSHQGYDVGTDVTEGFEASPHAMATLDALTIVGVLTE